MDAAAATTTTTVAATAHSLLTGMNFNRQPGSDASNNFSVHPAVKPQAPVAYLSLQTW